ncbi:MAG: hypothetical protein E7616_08120 [Ruminococcaceae bacterium]|nr:hypothetical protein [Oscillospiraceae bacterium]
MKRYIAFMLCAILLFAAAFPLSSTADEGETVTARPICRFRNVDGNFVLEIMAVKSDGQMFHFSTYHCFLTYWKTSEGETAAKTIYLDTYKTDGVVYYFDTVRQGFVPEKGVDYTFVITGFSTNKPNSYYKSPTISGIVSNFDPVSPGLGQKIEKVTVTPLDGGFVNSDKITKLCLQLTKDGEPVKLYDTDKWKLMIGCEEQSAYAATLSISPHYSDREKGIYHFWLCGDLDKNHFIPQKGREYTVRADISQGARPIYISEFSEPFICNVDPVMKPTDSKTLRAEPGAPAFENTVYEGTQITALRISFPEVSASDLETYANLYDWRIEVQTTKGEIVLSQNIHMAHHIAYSQTVWFDMTSPGALIEKGGEYIVTLSLHDVLGAVYYQVNIENSFLCEVTPIRNIVMTANQPAFTSKRVFGTYIAGYPAMESDMWQIYLSSTEDPARYVEFTAKPYDFKSNGLFFFEIPEDTEIPFSYGEALTLTARCETEDPALIYRSIPTEGYLYDYIDTHGQTIPPIPQNPILPPQENVVKENSFLLPTLLGGAVLLAIGVAAFFTYQGKKQNK